MKRDDKSMGAGTGGLRSRLGLQLLGEGTSGGSF